MSGNLHLIKHLPHAAFEDKDQNKVFSFHYLKEEILYTAQTVLQLLGLILKWTDHMHIFYMKKEEIFKKPHRHYLGTFCQLHFKRSAFYIKIDFRLYLFRTKIAKYCIAATQHQIQKTVAITVVTESNREYYSVSTVAPQVNCIVTFIQAGPCNFAIKSIPGIQRFNWLHLEQKEHQTGFIQNITIKAHYLTNNKLA